MRLKPLFILLGLLVLFWACAPQKPMPPLRESAEPLKEEVLTDKSIFDNAEALYKKKLFECHDALSVGHLRMKRTLALVHQHFYWPRTCSSIENYVEVCTQCLLDKAK